MNMEVRTTCLTHRTELKGLYCRECSVPVCFTCLEDNHKCHELVGVSTIVGEHKQNIIKELKDTWKHMDALNTTTDHSLRNVTLHHQSLCEEIEREAERQHQEIDKSKNDLLKQVKVLQQKHGKPLEDLKLRMRPFSRRSKISKGILDSLTDQEVVVLSTDLSQIKAVQKEGMGSDTGFQFFSKNNARYCLGTLVDERHALSDSDENNELCDKERSYESEEVKGEKDEVEEFYDCEGLPDVFKYKKLNKDWCPYVHSITPCSKDIFLELNTDKKLFRHTSGLKPRQIKSCVYQVKRTSKGITYFLIGDGGSDKRYEIRQLTPDQRMVKFSELDKLTLRCCIGFTSSGNLVVFSIHYKETYHRIYRLQGSRAALFVFNDDGKVQSTSFSTESDEWKNACPQAVTVLQNGNSIVLDGGAKSVQMFRHKQNKFWFWEKPVFEKIQEYKGVSGYLRSSENKFQPTDICFDLYGHILVSDENFHEIHLLDTNLKFLRFIAREKDGPYKPVSLSFDNSRNLWVGCYDNNVYILNYDTIYHSSK